MVIVVLFSLALGFAPAAFASPAIVISPTTCTEPSCTSISVQWVVSVDSNCPSGGYYTYDWGVTFPNGTTFLSGFHYAEVSCGVVAHTLAASGSSLQCGDYTFGFTAVTYNAIGVQLSNSKIANSIAVGCPPSVPEFGLPATMIAAISLLAVVLVKRPMAPK